MKAVDHLRNVDYTIITISISADISWSNRASLHNQHLFSYIRAFLILKDNKCVRSWINMAWNAPCSSNSECLSWTSHCLLFLTLTFSLSADISFLLLHRYLQEEPMTAGFALWASVLTVGTLPASLMTGETLKVHRRLNLQLWAYSSFDLREATFQPTLATNPLKIRSSGGVQAVFFQVRSVWVCFSGRWEPSLPETLTLNEQRQSAQSHVCGAICLLISCWFTESCLWRLFLCWEKLLCSLQFVFHKS